MIYGQLTRKMLEIHVLHDRNPIFVTLSDGSIRNGYIIKILNKTHEDKNYKLEFIDLDYKDIKIQSFDEVEPDNLTVLANSVGEFRVFVSTEKQKTKRLEVNFKVIDKESGIEDIHETIFVSRK